MAQNQVNKIWQADGCPEKITKYDKAVTNLVVCGSDNAIAMMTWNLCFSKSQRSEWIQNWLSLPTGWCLEQLRAGRIQSVSETRVERTFPMYYHIALSFQRSQILKCFAVETIYSEQLIRDGIEKWRRNFNTYWNTQLSNGYAYITSQGRIGARFVN